MCNKCDDAKDMDCSNCRTKKTPHKHAELIKAWADGAQIQYRDLTAYNNGWVDLITPGWRGGLGIEYRIKPEPKPDVVWYACVSRGTTGDPYVGTTYRGKAPVHHGHIALGHIRMVIGGETGELKSVEIVK